MTRDEALAQLDNATNSVIAAIGALTSDAHGQLEWLPVPCETEAAFFERLQIPEFPPPRRTQRTLVEFLQRHCYQPPDQEGARA